MKKLTLEKRLDAVLQDVIGAVDYDQAKQLDPKTAEEPDRANAHRARLRSVLSDALQRHGFADRTNKAKEQR